MIPQVRLMQNLIDGALKCKVKDDLTLHAQGSVQILVASALAALENVQSECQARGHIPKPIRHTPMGSFTMTTYRCNNCGAEWSDD